MKTKNVKILAVVVALFMGLGTYFSTCGKKELPQIVVEEPVETTVEESIPLGTTIEIDTLIDTVYVPLNKPCPVSLQKHKQVLEDAIDLVHEYNGKADSVELLKLQLASTQEQLETVQKYNNLLVEEIDSFYSLVDKVKTPFPLSFDGEKVSGTIEENEDGDYDVTLNILDNFKLYLEEGRRTFPFLRKNQPTISGTNNNDSLSEADVFAKSNGKEHEINLLTVYKVEETLQTVEQDSIQVEQ